MFNRLYNKGMSINQVAIYTGFARSAVQRYINDPRPAYPKHIITAQMSLEMKNKREQGVTVKQLAREYNVGETTIYNHFKGIRFSNAIFSVKDRMRMNELYTQGYTMKAIADIFGCSYTTVARSIWNPRNTGRKPNVKG